MRSKVVRTGFLVTVAALLAAALVDRAGPLWSDIQRLSAPVVVLAIVLGLGGLICSMLVWWSLLADLGSRLSLGEAWRNFFIGQLGKYVPGSIWPLLAQSEIGADAGVPRSSSALSVMLSYAVMTCTGATVAAVTLPFAAAGSFAHYFWVLFLVPVVLVAVSPPVLNRTFMALLRLLRRPTTWEGVSVRGLSRTMCLALAGWTFNGFMTYVLLRQLAGNQSGLLLLSVGGYALSWVAGFVAVFSPAGAGVREAVMVAILSTRTSASIALTVALLTRAISIVSDSATGGIAAGTIGRRRLQRLRATRAAASEQASPPA